MGHWGTKNIVMGTKCGGIMSPVLHASLVPFQYGGLPQRIKSFHYV
jgi:hypothetical protein